MSEVIEKTVEPPKVEPIPMALSLNANGEHKLQCPWCFWYAKGGNFKDASEYLAALVRVARFDTVESFWKNYVHLKRPSVLETGIQLSVMREGYNNVPMWEYFPTGGCWILKIKKKRDSGTSVLGKMWQDLVLAAIGEQFEEPDVVGVSLYIRKHEDLLLVWNTDSRNEKMTVSIGQRLKSILDLEANTVVQYKYAASCVQDHSTFRNATAYVFTADKEKEAAGEAVSVSA
jgi:translation initiation factor 4E